MGILAVEIEQECNGDGEVTLTLLAFHGRTAIGPDRPLALDLAELCRSVRASGVHALLFDPRARGSMEVQVGHSEAEVIWSFTLGRTPLELRFDARRYASTVAEVEERVAELRSKAGRCWRSVDVRRPS